MIHTIVDSSDELVPTSDQAPTMKRAVKHHDWWPEELHPETPLALPNRASWEIDPSVGFQERSWARRHLLFVLADVLLIAAGVWMLIGIWTDLVSGVMGR